MHCVQTTGEQEEEAVDLNKAWLEDKFSEGPTLPHTSQERRCRMSSADLLASEAIITLKTQKWKRATVFSILLTYRTKECFQIIYCAWMRTTEG